MNWGYKIFFLYMSFVALIMTLVVKSMNQKVDLVSSDYYEQELNYQTKLDAWNNSNGLPVSVSTSQTGSEVVFKFSEKFFEEKYSGKIFIYRPSDSSLDLVLPIVVNEAGEQVISKEKFKKGMYKLQIEWADELGRKFYTEQMINIEK